jgi:hypothetical protein
VVHGFKLLERISDYPTNGETPIHPIVIVNCGPFSYSGNDFVIRSIPSSLSRRSSNSHITANLNAAPQFTVNMNSRVSTSPKFSQSPNLVLNPPS